MFNAGSKTSGRGAQTFGAWMEAKRHDAFYRLGLKIADHAWTCIILSLLAALLLSTGIVRFHEVNNVRDHFTAENSPSRYEFAVAREFFRESGDPFHVIVALRASDGGNLLRARYLEKALEIEEHLQYGLKVPHEGKLYAYSDFCGAQCETTDTVSVFLTMFKNAKYGKKSSVKITFPTMDVYGHQVYLASSIFRVGLNNKTREVESAELIVVNFHAIYANASAERLMRAWERAVLRFAVASQHADSLVHVHATSEGLMSEEVRRTGEKAMPLIIVTFLTILAFTVLTSLKADSVKSKPWEAVVGVLCPLISLCASFGTLFWLGFEFLPIVIVVPFLILAVGVDDVFIVLHAWSQSDQLALPLRERVGHILAEAGPSITITSLTNVLSFGIGIFTPTPAIRIFCTYTCVAVLFDYLYQIFFYTAVIVIFGVREERRLNAYAPWMRAIEPYDCKKPSKWRAKLDEWCAIALDAWVSFSMSGMARILIAAFLCGYWTLSGYGVAQLRVGMSSEKLYLADSPLLPLVHLQREVIFKDGGQMIVFVNAPGNLRDKTRLRTLLLMLRRFEEAPNAVGPSSTQLWLSHYLSYISMQERTAMTPGFTYASVPQFMNSSEFHYWRHYVNLGTNADCLAEREDCVERFFFITGFHDAVTWIDRLALLRSWRQIANEFSPFNVTLFEHLSVYSDQLESIPQVTLQTVVCAFICMTVVMIIFTPHYGTIVPGIACLLSINFGVFGLLYFCDIDLDPISMTTTLMAIGLSVDFVAHISFHYYKGDFENQRDRLRHALASIGWPMMQAAASTVLSLVALAIIPAYMVQVFVKVITLVVTLGLFHGLVVLPIIFSSMSFRKYPHKICDVKTNSATNSTIKLDI